MGRPRLWERRARVMGRANQGWRQSLRGSSDVPLAQSNRAERSTLRLPRAQCAMSASSLRNRARDDEASVTVEGLEVIGDDEDRTEPKSTLFVTFLQIFLIGFSYSIVIPTARIYAARLRRHHGRRVERGWHLAHAPVQNLAQAKLCGDPAL